MHHRFTVALSCILIGLPSWTFAQKAEKQGCTVTIASPKSGQTVTEDAQVEGTASIPPGNFLWVFAHRKGLQLWWPQGGGPAPMSSSGSWQVVVTFGTERDTGREFEIATAVVDANTNEQLRSWVKRAEETGRYPGIQFPSSVTGCKIADVTVNKTR